MLSIGRFDQEVQFQSRAPGGGVGFANNGAARFGQFSNVAPLRISLGAGMYADVLTGNLSVRADEMTLQVVTGQRVVIQGRSYRVRAIMPINRRSGLVVFAVVGAEDAKLFSDMFDERGESVILRRIAHDGIPKIERTVRAAIAGFTPDEMDGNVIQGSRKAILSAADVDASGFPLPIQARSLDRVIVRGATLTPQGVDDSTWRYNGVLLAYELVLLGGG